jgi:hypothetical protein
MIYDKDYFIAKFTLFSLFYLYYYFITSEYLTITLTNYFIGHVKFSSTYFFLEMSHLL